MDFTIEPITSPDISAFWRIFKEVLETQFPGYSKKVVRYFLEKVYSEKAFVLFLQTHQKDILVAKSGKDVIGFAVIDAPYGGVSLCRWLGVKPDYQRKGVGTGLIQAWLELAVSQGCHKAEVAGQPDAKEFYEKVQLTLEGKREKSYFGIDQYTFGKVLGPVNDDVLIK